MDPLGNGLRGGKDLYILVPSKKTQRPAQSNQASSADDSSSIQMTESTTSTAATTNPTDTASSESSSRRTHRYTITASNEARVSAAHKFVPKLDHSQPTNEESRPRRGTVTLSRKGSKARRSPDGTQVRMSQMTSADAPHDDSEGYGTATILPPPVPVKDAYHIGNEAPARPIVSRPRYPPSSYRGPSTSSVDMPQLPVQSVPPAASSRKKGPPEQLLFGKLVLDDRNKAIDAPPSPHKPSGISRLVRRLSGRKKNKEPTPPPSPRNPPKATPSKAPDLNRTESSSSIPTAPTPYTSADETLGAEKQLKSRRRTLTTSKAAATPVQVPSAEPTTIPKRTTSTKRHRAAFTTTSTDDLPDPEEVYATTTYFTTCPHTSPPSHLPLNNKPTTAHFSATLLKYPPFQLRTRLAASQPLPTINIIQGSCSDCDWKARRQQEGEVLAKYADIRNNLLTRIKGVRAKMAERDGSSGEESDGVGGRKEKEKTEEDQDLELEMLAVESEIEELPERQDADVTRVWKGWAAKWGPGTVGIHRRSPVDEGYTDASESEGMVGISSNVSSAMGNCRATRSASSASKKGLNRWGGPGPFDDVVAEGRMKLDWIRPDAQKDGKRRGKVMTLTAAGAIAIHEMDKF